MFTIKVFFFLVKCYKRGVKSTYLFRAFRPKNGRETTYFVTSNNFFF